MQTYTEVQRKWKMQKKTENKELPTYRKTLRTKKVQTAEKKDIHTDQNSFDFFFILCWRGGEGNWRKE